jgi:hypothetical protein
VGERRRLPPVLPSFIYIIDGQTESGIGNRSAQLVNNSHIQAKPLLWGITFHSRSLYFRSYLGLDRMVVGLTTTDAISAYHHNVVNSNPADDEVYSKTKQKMI